MRALRQGVLHAVQGIFVFRVVAADENEIVTVIETPINIISPRAWNTTVGGITPWAGAVCVSLPEGATPLYTGAGVGSRRITYRADRELVARLHINPSRGRSALWGSL